ncbi:Glutamate decarboxylase 1 [Bagarius yarrelli]|uniref:Glutamate decarboxylase 1 n=1 Tax=Bagarius yarrelli TaxID=175774 RepID=A0A556U6J7_BAGYA|nr:Glutamate decarboxylase 1 [Bagarius yarrelli]
MPSQISMEIREDMREQLLIRSKQDEVPFKSTEQAEEGCSTNDFSSVHGKGGTISNLYSILLARHHHFPKVKTEGMHALPRLALFTSSHSHYSIKKSAAVLGIGTDSVIAVKCDERGKMIPGELESSIMAAKAKAAWGGGLLLSRKHKVKLQGIERASSITWNPHKMMGVPLQCSAILVRQKGLLEACNKQCAEYLFQTDKQYDMSYDTGDKTIQCGRHVDVFKLWLMWKAKGSEGFELQINHCLENAEYLYYKLKNGKEFQLVFQNKPEHSNVCFWYLPIRIRNMSLGPNRDKELHSIAPKIKAKMMENGAAMIGYQPLEDKPNFFRCVFSNPATQKQDVDFLLEEIASLGADL